jgi:hypothetical protein
MERFCARAIAAFAVSIGFRSFAAPNAIPTAPAYPLTCSLLTIRPDGAQPRYPIVFQKPSAIGVTGKVSSVDNVDMGIVTQGNGALTGHPGMVQVDFSVFHNAINSATTHYIPDVPTRDIVGISLKTAVGMGVPAAAEFGTFLTCERN